MFLNHNTVAKKYFMQYHIITYLIIYSTQTDTFEAKLL